MLPDFDTKPYSHILPSLDKALITTNDLVTLDAADLAKRVQVPPGDLKKLTEVILLALHRQLGFGNEEAHGNGALSSTDVGKNTASEWNAISTLDDGLDAALGGGIPTGYLIEVTGESGAGKTQLLLTLLLSSQLAPPYGLSKSALYISTEAPLATTRLTQLLSTHPRLSSLPSDKKPSLSRILSIQTPDLESQDHILRYQLPVAVKRHDVGLVVLDSVAANYRAEFERTGARAGAAAMAKRGTHLVQLGALLRGLARTERIAIVVANQVGDRFTPLPAQVSNAVSRATSFNSQNGDGEREVDTERGPAQEPHTTLISPDPLTFDHQQRWFTGWGDIQLPLSSLMPSFKTPSLGLVWTNQISCRIALIKQPVYASRPLLTRGVNGKEVWDETEPDIIRWQRWLKVVFAPWVAPAEGLGAEFEISGSGLKHIMNTDATSNE